MTSALIFFYPGTNSQVLIAALMCVLFLFLVSTNKPYRDEGDDRTNSVAYVCLVFTLLLGMALKVQQYEASDTAKQDEAMYTALLIIVNVTLVLFALWQMIMDAWAGANAKAEKAKMVGKTIKSRLSRAENDVALTKDAVKVAASQEQPRLTVPATARNLTREQLAVQFKAADDDNSGFLGMIDMPLPCNFH